MVFGLCAARSWMEDLYIVHAEDLGTVPHRKAA